MADEFYGFNVTGLDMNTDSAVLYGTSTTSADVEVRVNVLTPQMTRLTVIRALQAIERAIEDGRLNKKGQL